MCLLLNQLCSSSCRLQVQTLKNNQSVAHAHIFFILVHRDKQLCVTANNDSHEYYVAFWTLAEKRSIVNV